MKDEDTKEYKAGQKFAIPSILIAILIYFITDIGVLKAIGVWLLIIIASSVLYSIFNKNKE